MTESEKLQQLIELAWDNGYVGGHESYKRNKISSMISQAALSSYIGSPDENHSEGFQSENAILFDHEFIKALYISKYKESCWSIERAILMELAVSTNRIDYLYGVFCENT
jgi:hypothetical protein